VRKNPVVLWKEKVEQIESRQNVLDELKTPVNTLAANQTGQGNK
jgi:hypothetical protein